MGVRDIELRYRRSLLGPFWISASMVAMILTLAYLYSQIFESVQFVEYLSFLACGILAWNLISSLIGEACNAVMEHSALMRSVPLPMTVPAGRVLVRNAVTYLHNVIAVVIILVVFGAPITPLALLSFAGLGVILFIGYCGVLVLGPVSARFRDIPQLVSSVLQVIFFITPIIWMPGMSRRPLIAEANPFYHLIELIRAPLLGHLPTANNWIISGAVCAVMAVLAIVTLSATRKRVSLWV